MRGTILRNLKTATRGRGIVLERAAMAQDRRLTGANNGACARDCAGRCVMSVIWGKLVAIANK